MSEAPEAPPPQQHKENRNIFPVVIHKIIEFDTGLKGLAICNGFFSGVVLQEVDEQAMARRREMLTTELATAQRTRAHSPSQAASLKLAAVEAYSQMLDKGKEQLIYRKVIVDLQPQQIVYTNSEPLFLFYPNGKLPDLPDTSNSLSRDEAKERIANAQDGFFLAFGQNGKICYFSAGTETQITPFDLALLITSASTNWSRNHADQQGQKLFQTAVQVARIIKDDLSVKECFTQEGGLLKKRFRLKPSSITAEKISELMELAKTQLTGASSGTFV